MNNKFLKTNWKWFITTGIGLLGIIVSLIIFLYSTEKKSLSYEIISSNPLISALNKNLPIKILFDQNEITDLYISNIKITNNGTEPILPSDIVEPINIIIKNNSKILSFETVEIIPEGLNINIELLNNRLKFKNILLNSEDSFTIQILTHSEKPIFLLNTRIIGIKKIKKFIEEVSTFTILGIVIIFAFSIISAMINSIAFNSFQKRKSDEYYHINKSALFLIIPSSNFAVGFLMLAIKQNYNWSYLSYFTIYILIFIISDIISIPFKSRHPIESN